MSRFIVGATTHVGQVRQNNQDSILALEEAGIAVCLVNPRHVQNVSGRKSDVMDCQWLQYLHSVGLLRAAFRPAPMASITVAAPVTISPPAKTPAIEVIRFSSVSI